MTGVREFTLWPSEKNYEKYRDLCDDEIPENFETFKAIAEERILFIEKARGIVIEKLAFEPDAMALWCRAKFGKVDSESRRAYAAFKALSD